MSVLHDPNRLYAFLGPEGISAEHVEATGELIPRIADNVMDMAELIISKEIVTEESEWEARLHTALGIIGGKERILVDDDPLTIAESYTEYLGPATRDVRRYFEADRPLNNSPTGASRLRLEINAPAGETKASYSYTVTAYNGTPFSAPYRNPNSTRIKPLLPIPYQNIRSQFLVSSFMRGDERVPLVRAVTFDPTFENGAGRAIRTSIEASDDASATRLEAAHTPEMLPKLSQNQQMVHRTHGAQVLVHHNLAQMLRHLKEGNL
jgi:hypothetical protein